MPFFEGARPEDLVGAAPIRITIESPWPLVACNAFDVQHFACAHDRRLIGETRVEELGPYARRMTAEFQVVGESWQDRLTRWTAGDRLTMQITVWGGLLIFGEAKFHSTTTYGLLSLLPAGPDRTGGANVIYVRRRSGIGHAIDSIDARIRRSFIHQFLQADLRFLQNLRYSPGTLLEEDRTMHEYLHWLKSATVPLATNQLQSHSEESCDQCS